MDLTLIRGVLDETTNRVTLEFSEACPPDHPDPVRFVSTQLVTLRLPPGQVEITSIEPSPTALSTAVEDDDGPARSDSTPAKG